MLLDLGGILTNYLSRFGFLNLQQQGSHWRHSAISCWENLQKNCTKNLHICISRAFYASLVKQSIRCLVGFWLLLFCLSRNGSLNAFLGNWCCRKLCLSKCPGCHGKNQIFRFVRIYLAGIGLKCWGCSRNVHLEEDHQSLSAQASPGERQILMVSVVNFNLNSTKRILFATGCFNCFSVSWFSTGYISSQEFI